MASSPVTGSSGRHLLDRALQLERGGHSALAEATFNEAYRFAIREADAKSVVIIARRQAQLRLQSRDFEHAEELAGLSLEIARRSGFLEDIARAQNVEGMLHFHQARFAPARLAYEDALDSARNAGDDRTVLHASRNLGLLLEHLGLTREAQALYLEGVGTMLRENDARGAASIYLHLGSSAYSEREWMQAELYYRRAIELAELSDDMYMSVVSRVSLSGPLIETGELDEANDLLDEGEVFALKSQDQRLLADIRKFRARLAVATGVAADADLHLADALNIATTHKLAREKAEVLEDIGNLRQLQGRPILAKSAWREALEIFRELGAEANVARLTQLIQA